MKNIGIRLLWFAIGVMIGIFIGLNEHFLRQPDGLVSATVFMETDPGKLITISSETDAISRRNELISFIWGPEGLPKALPDKVEKGIDDNNYSGVENLRQINRLTINMEWGFSSTVYHFVPSEANNKLVIYHGGHDGDFVSGIKIIRFFLKKGFAVLALSMPLEPPNNRPVVDLERIGKIHLTFHDQLKLLGMKSGHPVQMFLTPIAIALNFAQGFGYSSVSMTGVSGGGWTTTLYAAIDPRVTRSYPVAGSLPLHLRADRDRSNTAHRSADWGDWEQTIPELYSIANYLELYILGSLGPGRKQLQILNKYDPCCLAGETYKTYEGIVQDRVKSLGAGNFAVYLDTSNRHHSLSDEALAVMVSDIG